MKPGARTRAARSIVLAAIALTALHAAPVNASPAPTGGHVSSSVTPSSYAVVKRGAGPNADTWIASAKTRAVASSAPAPTRPTESSAPLPAPSGLVGVCGGRLCADGSSWYMYGASILGGLDDPATTVKRARAAGLNTIRIVNFLDEHGGVASAPYSETHWARVDRGIATAGKGGIRVILDLSTYRNLLANAGRNPYIHDWSEFLEFAAMRRNTVTGVLYRDDPTIALIAIAGEVEPTNAANNQFGVTARQVTSFFRSAFATWRSFDPHHPVTSGGLLHYGWDSGIDWRAIFAAADVCSIHNYSDSDVAATPTVAAYCSRLGKPWIIEEFGWDRAIGDRSRAAKFERMFRLQSRYGAAGIAFWNLGSQASGPTFDVNKSSPLTLEAVVRNAP